MTKKSAFGKRLAHVKNSFSQLFFDNVNDLNRNCFTLHAT